MKHPHCALLLALLATGALAQTAPRSVQPSAQPAARAAAPAMGAAPATAPGAPAAAGLPSTQPFPAGIPSSVILPPGTAAPGTAIVPGTAPAAATDPALVVPNTGVAGAGAPGPAQFVPSGPSGYSALQIAQSFRNADANLNGELTRAEAQRLSIMPNTFEEMDRNKDGILSKSEYEDGVR